MLFRSNAVIGKLSRLNLTRGRSVDERRLQDRNQGRSQVRNSAPRAQKAVPRLQFEMLATIYGEADGAVATGPIDEANRCSLMELGENRCRWPISTPGAEDFCFCGNTPVEGMPYCSGHHRLAYRPGSRQRVVRGQGNRFA